MSCKKVERFAPSPTGPLHLGHAFSALTAARHADRFLLRMEDIDTARCRPEWEAAILDDLRWLGLTWQQPVLRQSERLHLYRDAVGRLTEAGLTYRCTCTRADIKAALSAPQEGAPMHGPDGLIYPGTCRNAEHVATDAAIRLNMAAAIAAIGDVSRIGFTELDFEPGRHALDAEALLRNVGDIVLARRDIGTSYHIAVVIDDAAQGVTHVTRGRDLFAATPLHRLLQVLLDLPEPLYRHHRLIRDENGKRLAKRDDARALATLRAEGWSREDVLHAIGFQAG
ncbi:tRNA glutamyl-Q(34) synthetase GluQRS [Pontivivens nitratireducens]|uniref:tRNA glutamyl-Q(34) synthetase GluQRS n=1 Tax=Pontivivens nitratireducens TaxID=2758038 RepID=A0A6G7VN99_9RHOB|nr:tRNA glutamyl-Q(34) synthetase GluQRS [Pontibrevibacter nitratireducens]QIK41390.1 tRNA glutamyl-Q(34) synthetase GluQRS [Pontibrevibacter nitratireducens]